MPSISHSEVESYLTCRRRHYYSYVLKLEKNVSSQGQARGSVGHAVLEAFYREFIGNGIEAWDRAMIVAYDTFKKETRWNIVDDDKHLKLKEVLFDWYFPFEPYVSKGYEVVAVEESYRLMYDEELDLSYSFVVDMVLRDPQGRTLVVDHKFLNDFYTRMAAELQPQIPKYIGALRGLKHKVAYGEYNMLRTRPLKKSGNTLSDRQQQLTIEASSTRVLRSFQEQADVAEEITLLKTEPIEEIERRAWRVGSDHVCKFCDYRALCIAELNGEPTKLMLSTEYRTKKKRATIPVSDDAE